MHQHLLSERCLSMLVDSNRSYGWGLDLGAMHCYVGACVDLLRPDASEQQIKLLLSNYHLDHAQVQSLRSAEHAQHHDNWNRLTRDTRRIVARVSHWNAGDRQSHISDLAQVALERLMSALPGYRYQSRFSTWIYGLVTRVVLHEERLLRAAKRAQTPDSIDGLPEHLQPADPQASPEAAGRARVLYDLIDQILAQHPDPRLRRIFLLQAVHDQQLERIGQLVHLHPSRVRALLSQARQLLRAHPAISAWYETQLDEQEVAKE